MSLLKVFYRDTLFIGGINYGPLVVRVGSHVERPENRTRYTDRPLVSVPLSPPVTASTVNISILGCSILQLCEVEVFAPNGEYLFRQIVLFTQIFQTTKVTHFHNSSEVSQESLICKKRLIN